MANDTEQLESLHKASLAVRSEIEAGIEAEGETSDLTLTLAHASIKTLEAFLGYLLCTYTPPRNASLSLWAATWYWRRTRTTTRACSRSTATPTRWAASHCSATA
jgi:hypothetical protein